MSQLDKQVQFDRENNKWRTAHSELFWKWRFQQITEDQFHQEVKMISDAYVQRVIDIFNQK